MLWTAKIEKKISNISKNREEKIEKIMEFNSVILLKINSSTFKAGPVCDLLWSVKSGYFLSTPDDTFTISLQSWPKVQDHIFVNNFSWGNEMEP